MFHLKTTSKHCLVSCWKETFWGIPRTTYKCLPVPGQGLFYHLWHENLPSLGAFTDFWALPALRLSTSVHLSTCILYPFLKIARGEQKAKNAGCDWACQSPTSPDCPDEAASEPLPTNPLSLGPGAADKLRLFSITLSERCRQAQSCFFLSLFFILCLSGGHWTVSWSCHWCQFCLVLLTGMKTWLLPVETKALTTLCVTEVLKSKYWPHLFSCNGIIISWFFPQTSSQMGRCVGLLGWRILHLWNETRY